MICFYGFDASWITKYFVIISASLVFYRYLADKLLSLLRDASRPFRIALLYRNLSCTAQGYYLKTWMVNQLWGMSILGSELGVLDFPDVLLYSNCCPLLFAMFYLSMFSKSKNLKVRTDHRHEWDGRREIIEIRVTDSWTSVSDQYLPENTRWTS